MDVQIECPCRKDGEPRHGHDTVTLRDTLDFRTATAIRNTIAFAKAEDDEVSSAEIMALLTEGYILHGIAAWTLVDEKGKAVPVSKPEIRARLLADPLAAEPIGEAADTLYGPAILLPLVQRALASSQPSPTDESTSPPTISPARNPKRSKPSSTSTSGTAGTATITSLHGGGSSSSPSSASAA
jgi:hypothetical protein